MAKNDSFRVSLFGGFNKNDVQEYIATLENEIESIKVLHQREKNELIRRMESDKEEQLEENGQVPKLNAELQRSEDEVHRLTLQLEEKEKELEQKQQELEQKRQELERQKAEATPENEERDEFSSEKEVLLQRNFDLIKEKEILQREKEEAEKKMEDMLAEREKSMLDYKLISKVLEDARQNARIIEEEAKKHSEEIIESANQEAQKQREMMMNKISTELEERGIQLIAAKHKIDQYAREVKAVQEGLYNLYGNMAHMVDDMPVRLDDFWKEPDADLESQESAEKPPVEKSDNVLNVDGKFWPSSPTGRGRISNFM